MSEEDREFTRMTSRTIETARILEGVAEMRRTVVDVRTGQLLPALTPTQERMCKEAAIVLADIYMGKQT